MAAEARSSPELPWKVRIMLGSIDFAVYCCCRSDGSFNRRLFGLFEPKVAASAKPVDGVSSFDVKVDTSRDLWFRIYNPVNSGIDSKLPVIVYFHPGGFISGSPNIKPFHDLCHHLAKELPAIVVSVNHRLSPEHRYPAPYDDGFDVLKFIEENQSTLPPNTDLSRCFLSGDSSGGNIAHHVTVRAAKHKFNKMRIIGLVAIQPLCGGEERTGSELRLNVSVVNVKNVDWYLRAFLPEGANRDHEAVNIFGGPKSVDISGLEFPATLLFIGGFDPLQDWQRRYYEGLKRAGKEVYLVEYPNAIHNFDAFPEFLESSLFVNELRDFISRRSAYMGE